MSGWQFHPYHGDVGHSFTNPLIDAWALEDFAYDARAHARSWAALLGLLGEALEVEAWPERR